MKEYKTNIMNIKWDFRKVLVVPVIVILNLLIRYFITGNMAVPLWLDNLGPMFGACVNGPVYGLVIAIVYNILVMIIEPGNLLGQFVFMALMAGIALVFGTIVRLGFFSNLRGVLGTILLTSFVEGTFLTPINFAFFGGRYSGSYLQLHITQTMANMGLNGAWSNLVGFLLIALLDNLIIAFLIYGIMKVIPEKLAQDLGFLKELPQFTIVESQGDESFASESDRLREKAQEKLNKKKEEEAVANSGEAAAGDSNKKTENSGEVKEKKEEQKS